MSGGESDVSDDSSDFERSPFRHLRRYLRCPLGTDSNETRDLSDVSLPRIEPPDLRSSRDSPSVEQHEQPTDARIPSEVKRVASIGFRNGSPNDAAMGQKILSNKRRATRAQVPSKQMYSSRTFRVPYIFEFVPFPGHTCKGRGTTQLETVVINVDSNSQLNRSFRYDTSFQTLLNKYNLQNSELADSPIEFRHVTKVEMQTMFELRSSGGVIRNMRERRALVVTLLKSYPDCQEYMERGKVYAKPSS